MKDIFDTILTTLVIALILAFLGWHSIRADQAVESYSQAIERQLSLERWAGR